MGATPSRSPSTIRSATRAAIHGSGRVIRAARSRSSAESSDAIARPPAPARPRRRRRRSERRLARRPGTTPATRRPRRPTSPRAGRRSTDPSRRAAGAGCAGAISTSGRPRPATSARMPSDSGAHDQLDLTLAVPARVGHELGHHQVRRLQPLARQRRAVRAHDQPGDAGRALPPAAVRVSWCRSRALLCEHTLMPALSKGVRATTHVLALRETFQIARGAADEETVVTAEFEHDGIVARGEGAPVDYWGETIEAMTAALEADGAALLGDDLFAGEAISRRIAAWDGPQGAKMALDGALYDWLGRRVGQPLHRAARHRPGHAADVVHDRHRLRRGDGRPHAPRDRLRGAQDQGRRAGRSGAPAGGPRSDGGAAADRRQRGLGPRHRARADPGADRAGGRVRRAAVPGRRSGRLPRLPRAVAAAARADRRGLQGPGVGGGDRDLRRRDRDQAVQVAAGSARRCG